ncbi:ECE2 [Blepharisma stoltei]|uniref:Methyltransferase domain-containing protein n=1 Tax=Blepharisma stoltei TaxID=1481888 RepID=A0AAU9KDL8_9CILI|nr:unnamed protein product [Blepharisma stoltei]
MEPENNSEYLNKEYWERRYENEETYDWLLRYPQVKEDISPYITPEDKILVLGCGNSKFSEDLYLDGYRNITNIDISQIVIDKMQEKHQDKPEMRWLVMNMLNMTFNPEEFDVVIDKATMDVLQCDIEDVWDPSDEVKSRISQFYQNVYQVLKNQKHLLQISFDQPHFRRKFVDTSKWNLSEKTLDKGGLPYFLYTLQKKI